MRKFIIALSIVLSAGLRGTAYGDNKQTDMHFEKGRSLYSLHRFGSAQQELLKAREAMTEENHALQASLDYYILMCAVQMGQDNARTLLEKFMAEYPYSVHINDVRFEMANLLYYNGEYEAAEAGYGEVDPEGLDAARRNEYYFKLGHARFSQENYAAAYPDLLKVGLSEYTPHAIYCIAYMDYLNKDYDKAKAGFASLTEREAYARIVPFYLLQIEFEQGNFRYVVERGDELLDQATPARKTEILRAMGESWFHLREYNKTLRYMYAYRDTGGRMGRNENYLTGYANYALEDYRAAVEELTRVCGPDDKLSQNAGYHLGDCYLHLGDKQSAMKSFSMASSEGYDPSISEDALFNYGKLQYELGGGVFNEAINVLNRYIERYPASERVPQVREYLISAYYNSRDYETAYEAIMQFPNPDNNIKTALQKVSYFRGLEYYNAGDYASAARLLNQSLQHRFNAKYTALTYFWLGEIEFERGNYEKAAEMFDSYVRLSPASERENVIARYNLGYAFFKRMDMEQARSWFDNFLARYADDDRFKADAHNRIGDSYYYEKEYWKAISSYDEAAALGTEDKYYSAFQRAMMLGLLDRPARKIESLKQIVSGGEGEYVDDALYELGKTYIAQRRYSDGAAVLTRFAESYPSSELYLASLSDLGLAYRNLKNNDKALDSYKKVVESAPNSVQAKDALAGIRSIYVDRNDVKGYFDYARSVGAETDANVVREDSLSYLAAEKIYLAGDAASARRALEGYLKEYPRGVYAPNALYYAGDCAAREGDRNGAAASYAALAEMYSNDFTARALSRLAPLYVELERYDQAADTYLKLCGQLSASAAVSEAWGGYLSAVEKSGDGARIAEAADRVLASGQATGEVAGRARLAKGRVLLAQNKGAEALPLLREAAADPTTEYGAEASFRVIEITRAAGDDAAAEKAVFAFSESGSSHSYWLARAFLVLGDIYADKGDNFQARATYQSIVDGYSPADDGIVAEAKEKIAKLK